jgi:hypothetical protein
MAGFLCIAMMKSSPHLITIGITEYEPDVWAETSLSPVHLLYYEGFNDPEIVENQYLQQLAKIGITVKSGKPFAAAPDEIIKTFIAVRDNFTQPQVGEEQGYINVSAVFNDYDTADFYENSVNQVVKSEVELLYDQAKECAFASEKAFQLYQQTAQLNYQPAYLALAHAYFNGWGVRRNVNSALRWIQRTLEGENLSRLSADERIEVGELLHNLAAEYENGSDLVIPDLKRAYQLNLQSAELGCELAYTSLACACLAGQGIEKNLNAALEWAMREIEANIIYGYNHATTCFVEAGMKLQAEQLWKRCFREQPMGAIATACLRVYKKQALAGFIVIDPDIEIMFSSLSERLANYQKELGVSIYDEEIAWLGVRDTCLVCHIPISPETARKTEGKCANCFIKELS